MGTEKYHIFDMLLWKSITSLTCYFRKVSRLWRVTSKKYHVFDVLLSDFWLAVVRWRNTACIGGDGAVLLDAGELMSTWVKEKSCEVMIASNRERERQKEKIVLWKVGAFSPVMLAGCIGSFFSCFNMTLGSFSSLLALLLHLSLFDSISFRRRALLHCGRVHFHHGVNRPQKNVNSEKWVFSAGAQAVLRNGAGVRAHQRTKNFSTGKECWALYWKTHFPPFLV